VLEENLRVWRAQQRSHVTIKARLRSHLWIEEIIGIAESEASSELYGILKRPDEKYVTERATTIRSSSRTWCAMCPRV